MPSTNPLHIGQGRGISVRFSTFFNKIRYLRALKKLIKSGTYEGGFLLFLGFTVQLFWKIQGNFGKIVPHFRPRFWHV